MANLTTREAVHAKITTNVTQGADPDRITGAEVREALGDIIDTASIGSETQANSRQIDAARGGVEGLEHRTIDLEQLEAVPSWTAADPTEAQIAGEEAADADDEFRLRTVEQAAALMWGATVVAPGTDVRPAGTVVLVRMADAEDPRRFGMLSRATGSRGPLPSFTRLGVSGGWTYWQWANHPHAFANTTLEIQKSASATHVGATLFKGSVTTAAVRAAEPLIVATSDAAQALARGLADIHTLIDTIATDSGVPTTFADISESGHGVQVGWAVISNDATTENHIDLDGTFQIFASSVGNRTPVIWTPIGDEPTRYRIEHQRGGAVHATYPAAGQYWRRYAVSGNDEVIASHHDEYFLASETNDAPIAVEMQLEDILQLQVGQSTEAISVPLAALAAAVVARLLPAFPAAGARNGLVPKFADDVLGWGGGVVAPITIPIDQSATRLQINSTEQTGTLDVTGDPTAHPRVSAVDTTANTFMLLEGNYCVVFPVPVFTTNTGSTRQTGNARAEIVPVLTGTGITASFLGGDYFRGSGSGVGPGDEARSMMLHVPSAGAVITPSIRRVGQANNQGYIRPGDLTIFVLS